MTKSTAAEFLDQLGGGHTEYRPQRPDTPQALYNVFEDSGDKFREYLKALEILTGDPKKRPGNFIKQLAGAMFSDMAYRWVGCRESDTVLSASETFAVFQRLFPRRSVQQMVFFQTLGKGISIPDGLGIRKVGAHWFIHTVFEYTVNRKDRLNTTDVGMTHLVGHFPDLFVNDHQLVFVVPMGFPEEVLGIPNPHVLQAPITGTDLRAMVTNIVCEYRPYSGANTLWETAPSFMRAQSMAGAPLNQA